jgi:hypothetical protein
MDRAGPPVWTVENGSLVKPGNGPELINDQKFQDFKLHVEFNCGKDANSGVYLRGRYEVQVETSRRRSHQAITLVGCTVSRAFAELPRSPDVWQTFDITLIGRRLRWFRMDRR